MYTSIYIGIYKVKLGCISKKYRASRGLGSTIEPKNILLMSPEEPQYLVGNYQRIPGVEHILFFRHT